MSGKSAIIHTPEDFSLVLGGPLYQLYLRGHLVRPPLQLLHRRILVLALFCWLPLVPLTIGSHQAVSGVEVPFLFDLDAHARFLVALPLLIVAEIFVHDRIRVILKSLVERGVIASD